jgi:uncharacterized membrane protein
MYKPTGTQYLVFQALDTLMLIKKNFFNSDTGIWFIEVLSPITNIAKIMDNGSIQLVEIEE